MNLFGRNKKRIMNANEDIASIGTNPTVRQLNEFFSMNLENADPSSLRSATYYACMLIRCNALAKLPIHINQYTEQEGAVVKSGHPLSDLLGLRPNPYTNAHDFKWATKFQELEHGNAYWVMTTKRGIATGVYLLDSMRVEIMADDIGILGKKNAVYYIYNDPEKGQQIYLSESIIHFKHFPSNGIVGKSVKRYLSDTIDNEKYAAKILKERYKSGLQDPIVVQYSGDLSEAKGSAIKAKFAKLGGAKNAGKVVPIPTDFKISQLETKLVNNQFFELQGLTTRQIANAFGVKGFQLNDMERSTYNNVEQQNKAFYSDTLQNDIITHEQEMTFKMLNTSERKEGYFVSINADAILRSDIDARYKSYESAIGVGWMSRADARALENKPYIPGTEILTVGNGAVLPLDKVGSQYAKGGENDENTTFPEAEPGDR